MENPFKPSEKYKPQIVAITGVAAFVAIALFACLNQELDDPYLAACFGATAVLIYGAPKAAFSRPKNVFFGHLFSVIIGIIVVCIFKSLDLMDDYSWIAAGIAVSVAIMTMMLTGTIHPPGGATALVCVMNCYDSAIYILRPIMIGIVGMMVIAYLANIVKDRYRDKPKN